MNIIFLIGKLKFSGAENVLRCIASEIARKGHTVEILVRNKESENDTLPGVEVRCCSSEGNALQRRLGRAANIRKEIKRINADLVVGFGFPMNFDAVTAAIGTKAKSIICERMDPYTCSKDRYFEIQRRFYYALADGYVVQTPEIRKFYKAHYSHKKPVAVIPNPVRKCYDSIPKKNGEKSYLVTVGRLDDAQKNQTMLIQAFAKVCEKYPALQLKLAGSGPDQEKYHRLISELGLEGRVLLLGNVPDPTDVVRNAEIFLLTSEHEGMPNALIEAMAQGKACITTRCSGGGAEYLVKNWENGVLIDRGDVDGCASAIEALMDDPKKRETIGIHALDINRRLSVDVIVDQWIEYFLMIS